MIDWISSKVAMTLAALILLAGVVSFYAAQRAQVRHDTLQDIADRAAAHIGVVSGTSGEIVTTLSLGPGGDLTLPRLAVDTPYSLTLYRSYVVAGIDGDRAFAALETPVHLWEPPPGDRSSAEVNRLDDLHPSLTIGSGGSMVVSRRSLTVDGTQAFGTFAFP